MILALLSLFFISSFSHASNEEELLQLLDIKYESSLDVEDHLVKLSDYFIAHKKNELYFNSAYVHITKRLNQKLKNGEFQNSFCLEKVIIEFSNMYKNALKDKLTRKKKVPRSWKVSFTANTKSYVKPSVLLLLGMNAHINHDLGIAYANNAKKYLICSLGLVKKDYFELNSFFKEEFSRLKALLRKSYNLLSPTAAKFRLYDDFQTVLALEFVYQLRQLAWNNAKKIIEQVDERGQKRVLKQIKKKAYRTALSIRSSNIFIPKF